MADPNLGLGRRASGKRGWGRLGWGIWGAGRLAAVTLGGTAGCAWYCRHFFISS